jgi:uncharacterized protein (TIGR02246 family)
VEETARPVAEEVETTSEAPADLMQAQEAYTAAWNADNLAALSAFFLDDATAKIGDETYTGRQQLETNWLQPRQAISTDLTPTVTNTERRGDDWLLSGTYTTMVTEPGAQPVQGTGRFAVTWTRTPEGQWRIRSSEVVRDPLPQN